MSFSRKDYEDTFAFARSVFFKTRGKNESLRELAFEACKIMDACEGVIGQQSSRPTGSLTVASIKDRADI
jgi:hypothetical protein